MNWKTKSTVGWSIGGVLLDIIGAIFRMLQMFILAYNNSMYIFVLIFWYFFKVMVRFIGKMVSIVNLKNLSISDRLQIRL